MFLFFHYARNPFRRISSSATVSEEDEEGRGNEVATNGEDQGRLTFTL